MIDNTAIQKTLTLKGQPTLKDVDGDRLSSIESQNVEEDEEYMSKHEEEIKDDDEIDEQEDKQLI